MNKIDTLVAIKKTCFKCKNEFEIFEFTCVCERIRYFGRTDVCKELLESHDDGLCLDMRGLIADGLINAKWEIESNNYGVIT